MNNELKSIKIDGRVQFKPIILRTDRRFMQVKSNLYYQLRNMSLTVYPDAPVNAINLIKSHDIEINVMPENLIMLTARENSQIADIYITFTFNNKEETLTLPEFMLINNMSKTTNQINIDFDNLSLKIIRFTARLCIYLYFNN